jgi:nitric oxide reductase large subunit
VYDVGVEEQRIKGFLAWIILITILLGIAIPIVEWIYMEIIK